MKQHQKLQQGQGMTEYIIILSLVSVVAISAFSAFGGANRAQVAAVANEIAGNHQGAKDSIQLAQNYAKYASANASYSRDMGNYSNFPSFNNYSTEGSYGNESSVTKNYGNDSSVTNEQEIEVSGSSNPEYRGNDDIPLGAPTFTGQITTQPAISTTTSTQPSIDTSILSTDSIEIYKGLTIITKEGGNNITIKKAIDLLPSKILTALIDANIKAVAAKDSVTEHFTELTGTPRGYLPGTDFSTAPGLFYKNTAVITTSGKNPSPSINKALHELGHGYDKAKGYLSRKSEFLTVAPQVLPGSKYFSQPGDGGLSESFAESFAQYYAGYTKMNSIVKNYWDKQ